MTEIVRPLLRGCLAAALLLAISGCATLAALPSDSLLQHDYHASMQLAESHARSGRTDAALAVFQEAAAIDPARKEPWLRMAQLHARNHEPALALLDAGKVLQRDPSDQAASELYIDCGLRIAMDALQRLRASGAAQHSERQPQARALVETIAQIYAVQDLLPEDISERLARQAIEQWQQENPQDGQPAAEAPATSPLDILGGD